MNFDLGHGSRHPLPNEKCVTLGQISLGGTEFSKFFILNAEFWEVSRQNWLGAEVPNRYFGSRVTTRAELNEIEQYINARYSVDRPNLSYIPRFYQHPTSQKRFLDLSIIVPIDMVEAADIAPSIVFVNFISRGDELLIFLDTLIPGHIPRCDELIKTYNSLAHMNIALG
jgi:hypothetical protein